MTSMLEDNGTPAEYVDLSEIIDWDAPQSLTQFFYSKVAQVIGQRIRACGDRVPVSVSDWRRRTEYADLYSSRSLQASLELFQEVF